MLLCPCYDFGIHGSQIDVGVRGSQIGIKWALDVGPRNLIFERTIFNEELTFLQNVFIFPINVVACGVRIRSCRITTMNVMDILLVLYLNGLNL